MKNSFLKDKKVLVGITGSLAAYKGAELVRLLRQAGAIVRVILTKGAEAFITPMTLQALSGEPVFTALLDTQAEAAMSHIQLARWADILIIAPASANVIARLAGGFAEDLLSTVALASAAPRLLAPAMNQQMWRAPAVQSNISRLVAQQWQILGPAEGEQACGDVGLGRLLEPQYLVNAITAACQPRYLVGISVLITAGPTREPLDPVRFISNYSSGKMGYALAAAAYAAGAEVTIISGPVALSPPFGVTVMVVETAAEMHQAVMSQLSTRDIFIGCAAVSDYRPIEKADQKYPKQTEAFTLALTPTLDIVADVAKQEPRPFIVAFAAETHELAIKAQAKRYHKKADMIVSNEVYGPKKGFAVGTNAATVFWEDGEKNFPEMSKARLAEELIQCIYERYQHAVQNTVKNS